MWFKLEPSQWQHTVRMRYEGASQSMEYDSVDIEPTTVSEPRFPDESIRSLRVSSVDPSADEILMTRTI